MTVCVFAAILGRMTWKEANVSELRMELVNLVRREGVSVTAAARMYGVSRKTANKWLVRFEEFGRSGLHDASRAPKSQPNRTDESIRKLIIKKRKRHPHWGPVKILNELVLDGWDRSALPAPSTAGQILDKAELVRKRPKRNPRPPGGGGPATADGPNDLWTADYKGEFRLGNGTYCYPLTIQDHHTKFVLRVRACGGTRAEVTRDTFRSLFKEFGVPRSILSDNGAPFVVRGLTGLTSVAVDWMKQDIAIRRSRIGCPQDNGSHERMHRDLKAETTRPPCRTMQGQQHRFTCWTHERNEVRPHDGIGGVRPASLYAPSPREYCARPRPWEYDGHWEALKVRRNGNLTWRSRPVYVSETLGGEHVGLEEVEDGIWRLCYRRTELGLLNERHRAGPRVLIPNPWWETKSKRRPAPSR